MKNKRKLILKIIGSLVLLYVVYNLTSLFLGVKDAMEQSLPDTHDFVREYQQLLSDSVKSKVSKVITTNSSVRNPVTKFNYQGNFSVVITKIDSNFSDPLPQVIQTRKKKTSASANVGYRTVSDKGNLEFEYAQGAILKIKSLKLNLGADTIQTVVQNDSVMWFASKIKNFSVCYNKHDKRDLFGEVPNKSFWSKQTVPVNIMFLKKNGALYFLLLYPNDKIDSIPETVFGQMIKAN